MESSNFAMKRYEHGLPASEVKNIVFYGALILWYLRSGRSQ